MEVPPLQPLRIPAGWVVEYNDLREADPSPQSIEALLLREDLLQLRHQEADVLIDVGWYGDAESGEFAIYVQAGDFRGGRLHEFRSRDRLVIVAEVERLRLTLDPAPMLISTTSAACRLSPTTAHLSGRCR